MSDETCTSSPNAESKSHFSGYICTTDRYIVQFVHFSGSIPLERRAG
jgi:hypothetical protein